MGHLFPMGSQVICQSPQHHTLCDGILRKKHKDRSPRALWGSLLLSKREEIFLDLSHPLTLSCKGCGKRKYPGKISRFILTGSHHPWFISWGRAFCSFFSIGLRSWLLPSTKRKDGSREGPQRSAADVSEPSSSQKEFWEREPGTHSLSLLPSGPWKVWWGQNRDIPAVPGSYSAFLGKVTAELGPEGQIRMMRQREWRWTRHLGNGTGTGVLVSESERCEHCLAHFKCGAFSGYMERTAGAEVTWARLGRAS